MPRQIKTCRVCGDTYEACNSVRTGDKTFNWREVACSPECGAIYLKQINESRNHMAAPKKAKHKANLVPVAVTADSVDEAAVETQTEPEKETPVVER